MTGQRATVATDWGWVGDWLPRLHRNVLGGWTFGWLWLRVYTYTRPSHDAHE